MKLKLLLLFILPVFVGQKLLAAPVISSFSPASGPVGTLVTITGTGLTTPTAFSIGGKPAIVISNTGKKLVGMVMPGAVTGAVTVTTSGVTVTAATDFTVLSTIRPTVQQGNKLIDSFITPSTPSQYLGAQVVLSADGNTAAVSGTNNQSGGFVDVFVRKNNLWTQQDKRLYKTGTAAGVTDLTISADGNLIAAGYAMDNNEMGSICTFRRVGTTWATTTESNQFAGTGGVGKTRQGNGVALSADGNTLVESGPSDNASQGAIWIFKYNGSKWIQQGAKITVSDNIGPAYFGNKVAISSDGKTILSSGQQDNHQIGAAWAFVLTSNGWIQQAKLVGTDYVSTNQQGTVMGTALALNADGTTAVVGGYGDNNKKGAVWVFKRVGSTWGQQGPKLMARPNTNVIYQGGSVSVTADGNIITEGASSVTSKTGLAWVFTRTVGSWAQLGDAFVVPGIVDKPGGGVNYSATVAISANGATAIVGSPYDGATGSIAAFSDLSTSPVISSVSPASGPAGIVVTIIGSNMAGVSSISIGGKPAVLLANTSTQIAAMVMPGAVTGSINIVATGGTSTGGNFTVVRASHPTGQQSAKLVGTGGIGAGEQGSSVAISADGKTAVVGAWKDNNNKGAIWIYTLNGTNWVQQGPKLVATGSVGSNVLLGKSVAISADGNTVAAGAPGNNNGVGAVWFFTRSKSVWTQQGNGLTGASSIGAAQQGTSLGLSADGNTAIIGGPGDNNLNGAVWFFKRSAGVWTSDGGKFTAIGAVGPAQFGGSLAIAANGQVAVIGGAYDNNNQGAVWIFNPQNNVWGQTGKKLIGTGNIGAAREGTSVALNADGSTIAFGGSADNNNQGAVWIYFRDVNGQITRGAKVIGTGNTGAAYKGSSVALSGDGNTLAVGGLADNGGAGAIWFFDGWNVSWIQWGTKMVGTGSVTTGSVPVQQGTSIALSADGATALTGGTGDNGGGGAVWPFYDKTTPVITFAQPPAVTYGVADMALGATSTNTTIPITYTSSDTTIATIVNNKVHVKAAGITKITATQTGNANSIAVSVPHFLTINKAALTITADDKAGSAGVTFPAFTATYTGFVYGETSANLATKPVFSTTATASSPVGIYPITASGAVSNNYTITYKPGTLTLRSASPTPQTITYNQVSSVRYGVADAAPDATSTNNTIPITYTSSDTTVATIVNGKIHVKNLGVTKVTASQSGNLYYADAKAVSHYITVVKAVLTITADNKTGYVSTSLPALTITYAGFVNGEGTANLTTLPTASTTATSSSPAGTYPITVSGAAADKYIFVYNNGTLTLSPISVPTISSFSPATAPTGSIVNITGTGLDNAISFTVGGKAGVIVSKTSTKLSGLIMPGSTAGKITVSTVSGTATSAGDIAIAPNPVPNSQQGDKLVATGATGAARQGSAIASSADGTTIVVGGSYDNNGMGAAWIYTRSGTAFIQQGNKLVGTGGAGSAQLQQGRSVAISADGNTVIIGGAGDNNNIGAAWVFVRTGNTWVQQGAKLLGSSNIGAASIGSSVALSADGNTALVGGFNDNGGIGAVWVFTRTNGVWAQQGAKLTGNDNYVQSGQGSSVSLSADGNTAVVGGQSDFNNVGASWVYIRTGSTWAQQGPKLIGSEYVGMSHQGVVSISADATTILIGGYGDNNNKGAIWIFTRNGTGWTQQGAKLVGAGGIAQDLQGSAVGLSADGNTAVVGGPGTDTNKGNTWIFTRTGASWHASADRLLGTGSSTPAYQGYAVAIAANGRTAFSGAPYESDKQGAVWVFTNAAKITPVIDTFQPLATVNYGAADVQLIATSTNTTLPIIYSSSDTTVAKVVAGSKLRITGGGSATITASQPGNAKYNDAAPVTQSITVNKVPLTVTANNAVVVRGTANPNFTVSYQGFINGDTAKDLTVRPTVTTTATNSSPAGLYTLTAGSAISSKYTFIYKPGVLTFVESTGVPRITSFTPKAGPVGGLVTITGANLYNSTGFTIGGKSAVIVSNTGSKLLGMVMPGAVNGTITLTTDSGSTVAPGNFTVIPASPPTAQQGPKLDGTSATGTLGTEIALSADGNTAIVTASKGVAVYTRDGNVWEQQAILTPEDQVGIPGFGTSLAISADGNTALIGGPGDSGDKGAAWVFVRNGNLWQQQGPKLFSDQINAQKRQGTSVSISADGNTAVLGAPGIRNGDVNNVKGGALVFKRLGQAWLQQGAVLIGKGPGGTYDDPDVNAQLQGIKVIISADGKTIIVSGSYYLGTFWTFALNADLWKQQGAKVVISNIFNVAVKGYALTADGSELLLGGYDTEEQIIGYNSDGPIYDYTNHSTVVSYKRAGESWNYGQTGYSYGSGTSNTISRTIVATSADKQVVTMTAAMNNYQSVVVFTAPEAPVIDLVPSGSDSYAMGLSADGSTAMVSNIHDGSFGSLRVFVSSNRLSQQITFNQPGPFTVGTADVTLAATSTNTTLPINFSSSDTTVATIVNNKLHIKARGLTTITASQDDAVITPVSRDVTINEASLAGMKASDPALAFNQNGDGLGGDAQKTVIPYPNPFVSGVKLNLGNSTISNAVVNVYELSESGKMVYSNQYNNTSGVVQLNLDNLKTGLYVLKLTTGKQVKVFKIMKR